ncbi:hypothetical protein PTI45_04496 [Paenibacillus nuruki]|uniref:Uncharacterized protein n=1 Tax=Paenibacillus nuruki TaxID=1886670 RepID=A0A1E3KXG1_9BACL|nr:MULTISPECIES: hypothetical protein [Paenibacillus]ODP26154.1 hypothetical protein PTI45_04496 [Paenibacillus nuruki]TKJ83826.1 hypothetical protein PaeCFBP13512_22155 [Paenibacillus sp. CFBP13512]
MISPTSHNHVPQKPSHAVNYKKILTYTLISIMGLTLITTIFLFFYNENVEFEASKYDVNGNVTSISKEYENKTLNKGMVNYYIVVNAQTIKLPYSWGKDLEIGQYVQIQGNKNELTSLKIVN